MTRNSASPLSASMLSASMLAASILPAAALAAPQELRYTYVTAGKREGGQVIKTDGARVTVDFEYNDRGRGPKLREEFTLDSSGQVSKYKVTGRAYMGSPVLESFDVAKGNARWSTAGDKGQQRVAGPYVYIPVNGTPGYDAVIARQVLASPGTLAGLPGGNLSIQKVETLNLEDAGGRIDATLYAITGIGLSPYYVWLDAERQFFGEYYGWSGVVREGWENSLKKLGEVQDRAGFAMLEQLAAKHTRRPRGVVAIRNVRVFDSLAGETSTPSTVYVFRERIADIDPTNAAPEEGTEVIDGTGHTLLPGLVDMHDHESPWGAVLQIAGGVTAIRDLANDNEQLQDLEDRILAGKVIGPRMWKAGFIDGKSPFSAPTGNVISSVAEGLKLIEWYAHRDFVQIKLYSSLDPAWVAPLTEAAHKYGMRVSGHIPAYMTAEQAVRAGYDEIQHINMLFLNFLADPKDDTRTPLRFTLVGEKAATLDLDSQPVRDFIALLKERGTVVDPTVTAFEGMFASRPGEYQPPFAMIAAHMPIAIQRALKAGVLDVNAKNEKQYAAATPAMLAFIRTLHEAGIPLVAGTDDIAGFTLYRELESYVKAGIPAARVLQIATIDAIRLLKADQELGSVTRGKLADLILVRGDPSANISDIRNVRLVMKNGAIYEPSALYQALGIEPFD